MTTETIDQAQPAQAPRELWVIIGALLLTMLLAALDQTIVATALPSIASDFNALDQLPWVVTAYMLTSAVSTPLFGKLSDLFGRKSILIIAVSVFFVGSLAAGTSQDMLQLVLFRGVQGIGAGGLMTLVFATIGDVVPMRDRGRYQGIFGAAWGLSSVAGPLLGGFFTDTLSWRWIFYINVPLGLIALVVLWLRLKTPVYRKTTAIDYLGALLISLSSISLLLAAQWGGGIYPWPSQTILLLLASGVVFAIAFVAWESRTKEPLVPLSLFRNGIFNVSSLLAFVSGGAVFAAVIFLPEYQQIVRGMTATQSGLMMLPFVGGLLVASIASGWMTSATGKYRMFPIVGTILMAIGFGLLSFIAVDTPEWLLGIFMVVLGLGVGSFLQVTTLAVQNSSDVRDLGAATAAVTFFRSIGGTLGTAILGSLLVSQLNARIAELLPQGNGGPGFNSNSINAGGAIIRQLPPAVAERIVQAFALAFHDLFLWAIPFAVVSFVIALFLRNAPLREWPAGQAAEPFGS